MIGWMILFLVAGMVLIISEFFLPGAILGGLGVLLVIISTVLGVYSYPGYGVFIVIGELVGVCICAVLGFLLLTRTRAGSYLRLGHARLPNQAMYTPPPTSASCIGKRSFLTALRPSGTINTGDKRIDAVSNGTFIEEGTRVRIVEVHGSRVVVEPVETV